MSAPSEVDIEAISKLIPGMRIGSVRTPAWLENFALEKVHHGKWNLVSGSTSFSGGILTLYNAGAASEMKSAPTFMYGTLLIYAKLRDTNSIIGFDDGSGNHVRITNNQFQVANAQATTSSNAAVTIDETAYHQYLIRWDILGCELWIDGVKVATVLTVAPHLELPIRLLAPSGGYLDVNAFHLWQDNPLVDPLGHQFYPKDINRLIPSINPTGRVIFQDPIDNSKGMDLKNWQAYYAGGAYTQIENCTTQNLAFLGGQSIRLKPTTTSWIGITKTLGFQPSKRFGIEAWLALEGDTTHGGAAAPHTYVDYIRLFIDWYETAFFYAGAIQWVPTAALIGKWQYMEGEAGAYNPKDWPGFTQKLMMTCMRDYSGWGEDFYYWLYFKMIVDFDARKYTFFQSQDQRMGVEQALIADSVQKYTASIEDKTLDFGIEYKLASAAHTPSLYIGAVIFTDEEVR